MAPRTRSWTKKCRPTEPAEAPNFVGQNHFLRLPPEIDLELFESLENDTTTSICLALTCRYLYRAYKTKHHIPAPLTHPIPSRILPHHDMTPTSLAYLLQGWMPDRYIYNPHVGKFLDREVYGERIDGRKARQLFFRYFDYWCTDRRLPNPHNMEAAKWYKEAVKIIMDDYHAHRRWFEWELCWAGTFVFKNHNLHRVMGRQFLTLLRRGVFRRIEEFFNVSGQV